MTVDLTAASKKLAYALRHKPEAAGLTLDLEGWAPVGPVLAYLGLTEEQLRDLVGGDAKQRYSLRFDATGGHIRAAQGHSTAQVALAHRKRHPPAVLYHGTKAAALPAIRLLGLLPGRRHHVHLSAEAATAVDVGDRRQGETVVLAVRAGDAALAGHPFYLADNGVWLADSVPPSYLELPAK